MLSNRATAGPLMVYLAVVVTTAHDSQSLMVYLAVEVTTAHDSQPLMVYLAVPVKRSQDSVSVNALSYCRSYNNLQESD